MTNDRRTGERRGKPPAFQFYAADFLVDATVKFMTLEERGAYVTLLAHSWIEGALPAALPKLARLCEIGTADMERLWPAIAPCWKPADREGFIVNPRMESERRKQAAYRKSQSDKAKEQQARLRLAGSSGGAEPVPSSSSLTSSSSSPKSTTTVATQPARRADETNHGKMLGLVREHCWKPDGKCPETVAGKPWTEAQEVTVVRELRKSYSASDVEVLIIGLGNMVRGLAESERPDWLPIGSKVSLRAIYRTRSGVAQMAELCRRAYWAVENKRGTKKVLRGVSPIGDVLENLA